MVHFALSSASFTWDPYLKSHNCTRRTPFFPWRGFWESEDPWSLLLILGHHLLLCTSHRFFLLDFCQILKNRFHTAMSTCYGQFLASHRANLNSSTPQVNISTSRLLSGSCTHRSQQAHKTPFCSSSKLTYSGGNQRPLSTIGAY